MSLELVARSSRALSEHLNRYYRVLKAVDPESVLVRLPGGGSFEVRHSVTAAPLVAVTDAGVALTGAIALPAGSVTSAMIADGTIVGADIAPSTITPDKLTGLSGVPADSITTVELANGAVATANLAASAVTQSGVTSASASSPSVGPGGPVLCPDMSVTFAPTGGPVLMLFTGTFFSNTAGAYVQVTPYLDNSQVGLPNQTTCPAASAFVTMTVTFLLLPSATSHAFQMYWSTSSGTLTAYSTWRSLSVVEFKR